MIRKRTRAASLLVLRWWWWTMTGFNVTDSCLFSRFFPPQILFLFSLSLSTTVWTTAKFVMNSLTHPHSKLDPKFEKFHALFHWSLYTSSDCLACKCPYEMVCLLLPSYPWWCLLRRFSLLLLQDLSFVLVSLSFSLVSIISLTHRNESSLEIVSQLNVSFCYHPVRLLVSKISWVVDVKVLYHFPLVVCLSTFCNPKVCPFRYRSIVLYIWSVLSCITRNSSKSCMFSYTRTYIMAPTTIFSTSILAKTKKAHTLQNNRSVSLLCLLWQHICCFEVIWSLVYL